MAQRRTGKPEERFIYYLHALTTIQKEVFKYTAFISHVYTWSTTNTCKGRPAWQGRMDVKADGTREKAPTFNTQALVQNLAIIGGLCSQHGVTIAAAIHDSGLMDDMLHVGLEPAMASSLKAMGPYLSISRPSRLYHNLEVKLSAGSTALHVVEDASAEADGDPGQATKRRRTDSDVPAAAMGGTGPGPSASMCNPVFNSHSHGHGSGAPAGSLPRSTGQQSFREGTFAGLGQAIGIHDDVMKGIVRNIQATRWNTKVRGLAF